jgi:hypothetical protein
MFLDKKAGWWLILPFPRDEDGRRNNGGPQTVFVACG